MLERGAEKEQDNGLGWSVNIDWNRVGQTLMSFDLWCITNRSSQLLLSAGAVKSVVSQGQLDCILCSPRSLPITPHNSFAGVLG